MFVNLCLSEESNRGYILSRNTLCKVIYGIYKNGLGHILAYIPYTQEISHTCEPKKILKKKRKLRKRLNS